MYVMETEAIGGKAPRIEGGSPPPMVLAWERGHGGFWVRGKEGRVWGGGMVRV